MIQMTVVSLWKVCEQSTHWGIFVLFLGLFLPGILSALNSRNLNSESRGSQIGVFLCLASSCPKFEPRWSDDIFVGQYPGIYHSQFLFNIPRWHCYRFSRWMPSEHSLYHLQGRIVSSIFDIIIFCLHKLTSSLFKCELYREVCF